MKKMKISQLRKLISFLLYPGDRLSHRVIHAGFWEFALRITDRLFGLSRTIILARLLSPNDFGLFGIALLGFSALDTFSQTGFQAALVQKKGDIKPYLDTAWTVQVIRGFVLAGILFGIAPYVASFFGEPAAATLLRVLGLSAVFQGLTNIGVVYFQKELEFHKRFIYMFSGTLADLGVAIPSALILRNAWALVFGLLAGNFVRMVISYLIHPYHARPHLARHQAEELFTFGRWVLGNSVVVFLIYRVGDFLVGKVLGAASLGLYQLACRLADAVAVELSGIFSQVTFPAFSKIQDQRPRLKEAFLYTIEAVITVALPVSVGILILAPYFVRVFLGEVWLPIISALQLLAGVAFLRSIMAVLGSLFQAIGRPNVEYWLNLTRLLLLAICVYPLTVAYGISGTAASVLLSTMALIVVWMPISMRIVGVDISSLIIHLVPSVIGTMVMTSLIFITRIFLPPSTLLGFALAISAGIAGYIAVEVVIWHRCHSVLVELMISMIKGKGG